MVNFSGGYSSINMLYTYLHLDRGSRPLLEGSILLSYEIAYNDDKMVLVPFSGILFFYCQPSDILFNVKKFSSPSRGFYSSIDDKED